MEQGLGGAAGEALGLDLAVYTSGCMCAWGYTYLLGGEGGGAAGEEALLA